jgi:CHAD domain-containing protein
MKKRAAILMQGTPVHSVYDALSVMLGHANVHRRAGDESVHAARKTMKRIRASLRLIRAGIGETAYRLANRQIRDGAKPLTPLRDAAALLRALKTLHKADKPPKSSVYFNRLQEHLEGELRAQRRELTDKAVRKTTAALHRVAGQLEVLPVKLSEMLTVPQGLKRIYRQGRAAGECARRDPGDANLHEWRKQTKYLANAIELSKPLILGNGLRLRRRSRKLAGLLGDDHDLAILIQKIRSLHRRGLLPSDRSAHRAIKSCIKARRRALQNKALPLGKRLYRQSMRHLTRAITHALVTP